MSQTQPRPIRTLAPLLCICLLAVLASSCGGPPEDPLVLVATVEKACDRVQILEQGSAHAIAEIHSGEGMGKATITTKKGWPGRLILRFHLTNLDLLVLSNSELELRSSHHNSPRNEDEAAYFVRGDDGRIGNLDPPAGKVKIVTTIRPDGGIDVIVPPLLLEDPSETLTIVWVDHYRR